MYTNDDTLMDHSGGGGGFTLDLTLRIKQNEKKIDRLTFTFLFRFLSVCMSIISYRYLHLEPFIFMRKNYLLFKDIYQNVDDYDELFNGRLFSNNNQNNNIDIWQLTSSIEIFGSLSLARVFFSLMVDRRHSFLINVLKKQKYWHQ